MKVLFSFVFLIFISSCASNKDQQDIKNKMAKESQVTDGKSLDKEVHALIAASKTLSEKQKAELTKLISETKVANKALIEESFKLRGVLMKELLAGKAYSTEVKLLKKKIKKNESLRLKNTFEAADKVALIVSKDPNGAEYMQHFILPEVLFH